MTASGVGRMNFFKLEALGNDFVLIDARTHPFSPTQTSIVRLANRRTGIGFDQMLVLGPGSKDLLAEVDIFNADGSRAEQCGNGMRAIAAWLDRGRELLPGARVGTPAGPVELGCDAEHGYIAVLPGPQALDADALGLPPPRVSEDIPDWLLVSLGNPHLIGTVARPPSSADLANAVRSLEDGPWHGRVNIGLMHIESDSSALLRVHERGAGPTLACGSAACAAAWALRRHRPIEAPVAVRQPGGALVVDLTTRAGLAVTIGPAAVVFEGKTA